MIEDTEALVCVDIRYRQQMGIKQYGSTLADNPLPLRDWLQHAYEEALDQALYLRRAIQEMDAAEEAARPTPPLTPAQKAAYSTKRRAIMEALMPELTFLFGLEYARHRDAPQGDDACQPK